MARCRNRRRRGRDCDLNVSPDRRPASRRESSVSPTRSSTLAARVAGGGLARRSALGRPPPCSSARAQTRPQGLEVRTPEKGGRMPRERVVRWSPQLRWLGCSIDASSRDPGLRMGPMGLDPPAAGPACCGSAGSPWSLLSNGGKAVAALSRLIFPTTPLSAPHEIHCTPARAAPGAGRATATSLRCAVGRTRFARAGGVHSPRAGGCDPGFQPCLYGLGTSRLLCT